LPLQYISVLTICSRLPVIMKLLLFRSDITSKVLWIRTHSISNWWSPCWLFPRCWFCCFVWARKLSEPALCLQSHWLHHHSIWMSCPMEVMPPDRDCLVYHGGWVRCH
jgi:hypothetical protein